MMLLVVDRFEMPVARAGITEIPRIYEEFILRFVDREFFFG